MKFISSRTRRRIRSFRNTLRHLSRKRQIMLAVWTGGSILVVIALATTIYFAASLGSKERIMNRNNTGVTLLDQSGEPFYTFYNAHSETYVSLDKVNPLVQKAVIAAEDKDFYKHAGFSPAGLVNAVYQNLRPGGINSGGSTLTQQLVKNALLSNERSYLRKYQELVLSIEIERRYSKQEILEMYLNSVYFGEGAFGIEDAAQTYFGKSAADLDLAQSSMLAGLLPAPSAYSPISGSEVKAKRRQAYVLGRMQEDGIITKEQEKAAKDQALSYVEQPEKKVKAPHFALMVKKALDEKYGEEKVARSGYKVTTTLNMDMQNKAESAVDKQVSRLSRSKVSNGAAVAIDPHNGQIRALVGSRDWYNTDFGKVNIATSTRQPGSSFKPLVYATGIENKDFSAATIWEDKPTDFGGGYAPKNYDLRYHGDVTTRQALGNSLNIPAVAAIEDAGISSVISSSKKLGITTLDKSPQSYGLSLALGTGGAKLTEMTNAYATMANAGSYNELSLFTSIKNKYNKEIFKDKSKPRQALDDETAFIMSSMMSDNAIRAGTFGNSLALYGGRPAAAKTGTTQDFRDAWTIGYTPSLAVGVWIGNNDNTPMSSIAGSLGAAPIWREVMNGSLQGSPFEQFKPPSSIITRDVCRGTGGLAEHSGENTYQEYFRQGTLPSKTCNAQTPPKEEPKKPEEEQNTKTQTPEDQTNEESPTDNDQNTDQNPTPDDDTNNTDNGSGQNNDGSGTSGGGTGTGTGNNGGAQSQGTNILP